MLKKYDNITARELMTVDCEDIIYGDFVIYACKKDSGDVWHKVHSAYNISTLIEEFTVLYNHKALDITGSYDKYYYKIEMMINVKVINICPKKNKMI